jgi:hypothetical protein
VIALAAALALSMLQATPAVRTIERGDQSGIETPKQVVVRTAAEWTALWRQHAPERPVPSIDWSKEMVVGIFLGSRNTAGYGVDITGVASESGALVVRYRQREPSPDAITAQIITTPYQIVAIPSTDAAVRFERAQ